ncbi:CpeT homolog [Richelia intracellularis HH01]|mgnify:CR=1 FL=1|uniref:Chromophore lyase CpcT/CpeT n=1 Tax=Richelia intracellularis HH01 TaxID=1165094 RepID=M1X4T1_9NOST|nr:chromophore lyase CpcT/CpeT [Richelia intracellularis]CCH66631.1 CpeT homolog [Richelia intracellularis HH01]
MTASFNTIQLQANNLVTLANWMAGDFSNYKQSFDNPKLYAHIHISFRPLPFDFFNSIGFYSEQAYDYDLWTPYRQGVHKLVEQEKQVYIENYSLQDSILYAGASRELDILRTITQDSIKRRYNCSMIFRRDGEMFHGIVEPGNSCLIEKKGCLTYLVSDVEITETTWKSIDRGMHPETHEQIWGSEHGPLYFEKVRSFANELTS